MPEFFKNRFYAVVLAIVAVVLVATGAVFALRPERSASGLVVGATPAATSPSTTGTPSPEASPSPGAPLSPGVPPSPEASTSGPSATAPTCTNYTGDMETPTRFIVERMGVDSPMMVVGKDADGNPGAPPPSQAYTTAWYNGSPAPGTTQGNVILTIHTYSKGQALGNDLYGKNGLSDGKQGLREGDLIKISDDQGHQVCYRYSDSTKVWVETYDPDSGVFHNPDGPAQLAIMICWDYAPSANDWDSRIIFYAGLIPEGTPA
jgi:hypothetical protein